MTIEETIESEFKEKILDFKTDNLYRSYIYLDRENLIDVATYLQHEMGFTLSNMCVGTDLKDKMEVSWYIGKPGIPDLIVLRVHIDRNNPEIPSLTHLWQGFNWHERETYDLLGIIFNDHPDLRRLLLPDNWEGFPLREDYVYKRPSYRKPEEY